MSEGQHLPKTAPGVLAAWLAAPADPLRMQALAETCHDAPVSALTVDRLPVAAIPALRRSVGIRLAGLRPPVRQAALVSGVAGALGLEVHPSEQHDLDHLPFVVTVDGLNVVVEVSSAADRRSGFSQPIHHQWAGGIDAQALVIDCHRLEHVNSVMIAWMLQLVQAAKPMPVHVRRARPQVVTQLKQLRLDHLMAIE